jgi:hypothetical protein
VTGAELLAFVKDRLALANVSDERLTDPTLYRFIRTARNRLLLALRAPFVVRSIVTLEQDPADERVWTLAEAAPDPLVWLEVRKAGGGVPLFVASNVEKHGHYEPYTLRSVRSVRDYSAPTEGLEAVIVGVESGTIGGATTEADIGVWAAAHEAVGYLAAKLAMTVNNVSAGESEATEFEAEMALVMEAAGGLHAGSGHGLRDAFVAAYSNLND